jgi:hypothetical protein
LHASPAKRLRRLQSAATAKLAPGGEVGNAAFGSSVAQSADGRTTLVGGPGDSAGRGAAWVFRRSAAGWRQQGGKLTGGSAGGGFGASVALSADGNTALVGSPGSGQGAADVFVRRATTWARTAHWESGKSFPGGSKIHLGFGASVALSGAGDVAMVSGPQFGGPSDTAIGGPGAVWVFTRHGSTWAQTQKLAIRGPNLGNFGTTVVLSADGRTALISGAWSRTSHGYHAGEDNGAVWVFVRQGSVWQRQGPKLTARDASHFYYGEAFGASLALSRNGDTALIGGPADNDGYDKTDGAAWVFVRSHGVWTQQGRKLSGSGQNTHMGVGFGTGVALSADGNTAVMGGPDDNSGTGAIWLYRRTGTVWKQQGTKTTLRPPLPDTEFGTSVALTADGTRALVGGPGDRRGAPGAAWVLRF